MKRVLMMAAGVIALAAPTHAAQLQVHGTVNNGYFNGYVTERQSFGEAFAKGFNDTQSEDNSGSGLGTYIPGVISGARSMSFEIQISTNGGGVRAFDPVKRERFAGSYVRKGGLFVVDTSATMVGDHGSRLNCNIQIHAGSTPTGIGSCVDMLLPPKGRTGPLGLSGR